MAPRSDFEVLFLWCTIAGALYINVGDAALVVFRFSIAYNCYLLNMYMPLAMRYCATGTACKFFTVPMTNTLCTEPIDSISPRRLSTKS